MDTYAEIHKNVMAHRIPAESLGDIFARGLVVDSIAALKALDTTYLSRVFVLNYYASGSGGGGAFVFNSGSSATDNGGTVIAPDVGSGRWIRVVGNIISVKDFGAVGSGNEATEFQATVDALPSHGGMILVPDGDYSATTGVTKGSTQEIVWLGWNATLPAGLPGTAIDLGRFATFIVAGESSRNGLIAHRVRLGDREVPANEIDRVYHVEATMPTDAGISTQRELIAYSFLLETDHHEPNGGDIRGVKGIVRGDGGQANIRAAHFLAQGYNSHTGDVTGVLSDVFHSDKVTGANDPVGKSYCFLAQVGPGMASGYELRSSLRTDDNSNPGAKERPNYGYRVQEGANAVLPEIACFQGHGGGNGDIFRGLASDTDSTVVFSVDNEGRVLGKAYRSGHQSIANEGTHVITPPDGSGFLEVYAEGTTQAFGRVFYRAGASPSCVEVYGGTAFGVSTADLTGTTGTPGDLTVSAKSDGNIEIENQTGSTRTVVWFFMSRE